MGQNLLAPLIHFILFNGIWSWWPSIHSFSSLCHLIQFVSIHSDMHFDQISAFCSASSMSSHSGGLHSNKRRFDHWRRSGRSSKFEQLADDHAPFIWMRSWFIPIIACHTFNAYTTESFEHWFGELMNVVAWGVVRWSMTAKITSVRPTCPPPSRSHDGLSAHVMPITSQSGPSLYHQSR